MIEKISSMGIVISNTKDSKRVLLLNNEGEWVFPKGHVEDGEDYFKAAIREVKEESGVKVVKNLFHEQIDEFKFYFDGEKAVKIIKVFLFEIKDQQDIKYNKDEGFIDGGWFELETALKMLKHDDAKSALRKGIEILDNR